MVNGMAAAQMYTRERCERSRIANTDGLVTHLKITQQNGAVDRCSVVVPQLFVLYAVGIGMA